MGLLANLTRFRTFQNLAGHSGCVVAEFRLVEHLLGRPPVSTNSLNGEITCSRCFSAKLHNQLKIQGVLGSSSNGKMQGVDDGVFVVAFDPCRGVVHQKRPHGPITTAGLLGFLTQNSALLRRTSVYGYERRF
jgi:hypothetical protein